MKEEKRRLTEEEIETLREKAINNAMQKFSWTRERSEKALGRNYREFMSKVNLVSVERENVLE